MSETTRAKSGDKGRVIGEEDHELRGYCYIPRVVLMQALAVCVCVGCTTLKTTDHLKVLCSKVGLADSQVLSWKSGLC